MYYAPYSLVGDERILADVTEASPNRFNALMAEHGYHLNPLWVDQTSSCPTTPAWWAKVLSWDATGYCAGDAVGITPLLLHLPMHCAGAAVLGKPDLPVIVFDPTQPEQLAFETLADFSASNYGRCIMVSKVKHPARARLLSTCFCAWPAPREAHGAASVGGNAGPAHELTSEPC